MAERNDLNTPAIALVGVIGVVLTAATIMGLTVVYYHAAKREREVKVIRQPWGRFDSQRAGQLGELARFDRRTLVDEEGHQRVVYSIPIDLAMELVVGERSGEAHSPPPQGSTGRKSPPPLDTKKTQGSEP